MRSPNTTRSLLPSIGVAAAALAASGMLIAALAIVTFSSPASAAPGVPYAPSAFSLSSTQGPPGTKLTARGTCHPGATVPYHFVAADGSGPGAATPPIGDLRADGSGAWSVDLAVLESARPGERFEFGTYCIDGNVDPVTQPTLSTRFFTVTPPAAAPSPTRPPTSTIPDRPVVAQPSFTG